MSEDGRPQSIHYFSRETDLPLTLGLLVDTSRSQRRVLEQERRASQSFLDQVIRENRDKAFVIHFDREVELLQDATGPASCCTRRWRRSRQRNSSLAQVRSRFRRAGADDPSATSQGDPCGHRRGGWGSGTPLYGAVYLASKGNDGRHCSLASRRPRQPGDAGQRHRSGPTCRYAGVFHPVY